MSNTSFSQLIQSDKPTFVDFSAEWCGPCKQIAPILDQIANENDGKLTLGKLDVDHNQNTAMKFGVMSIPTLLLFKDGKVVERLVGMRPKADLMKKISPHLS